MDHSVTAPEGLRRFFAGMVQPSFATLGLGAGETADYVVDIMARFARTDQLYRVRDSRGRPLESVTDLLTELMEQWPGSQPYHLGREVELRRHVGDYALFMSGVFRAHVEHGGYLDHYLEQGGENYRAVGDRMQMMGVRQAAMFTGLGREFEVVSGALDYISKVYMVPAARSNGEFSDLMRRFDLN